MILRCVDGHINNGKENNSRGEWGWGRRWAGLWVFRNPLRVPKVTVAVGEVTGI